MELLLVVAIVAIASVGVTLAMRDTAQSQLESEAQRLAALLESARAQSRASGVPVRWRITETGFALDGLTEWAGPTPERADTLPTHWQSSGMAASTEKPLLLGPEPIIAPQTVRLWMVQRPQWSVRVSTDGVRPFSVQSATP